ncbi:MAG: glycosyltransferase [Pseudorhodoplanes sp.]
MSADSTSRFGNDLQKNGRDLRRLAGATVLQIAPKLRDDLGGRTVLNIASALRRAGARAIVAAEGGALGGELRAMGGEWLPLETTTVNPLKLRRNARLLERYITAERVDIVHAQSPGAAWSALAATEKLAVWLVTNLPDTPAEPSRLQAVYLRALGRGDRVLVHSTFTAAPLITRYRIPPEQVSVIPHAIDAAVFSPAAVRPERVMAMRKAWRAPAGERIVFCPGPLQPSGGQFVLIDAARILAESGMRGISFILAGDPGEQSRYARAIAKRLRELRIENLVRIPGAIADLPAALAASDVTVMPALKPPLFGKPMPEAQAMARPVIASALGILPENMLAPPRMPDELRTGWLVPPGDPFALSQAVRAVLALDVTAYRALAARARQFAEFMFLPDSVAAAVLGVYSSLLEGQG